MSKFANQPPRLVAPIQATDEITQTHENAPAYVRDAKSELFLLAVTNMVSEPTFYEAGSERDRRFVSLIHQVTKEDAEWMRSFIPWLRKGALMRSASTQAAAEYVKAGGPNGRQVIAQTLNRADEPGELLAYWFSTHGRALPAAVKRGVADAAQRLYTERAALKYDGKANAWRMADVIQLAHVKPKDDAQSQLFKYLLDRRFGGESAVDLLPAVAHRQRLEAVPESERRGMLGELSQGETWEWLSGWVGAMDAEAWEAVIPHMGYMALLRNLRNFDQADISAKVRSGIITKLIDPEEVAQSRQFPYRFWSAYKNTGSLNYAGALETALELSVRNVPDIPGRTLVLTDTSGSMQSSVSERSKVQHYEIAALFAASVAKGAEDVRLISWADSHSDVGYERGDSVLRTVEKVHNRIGRDGHGTQLGQALRSYSGEDRVVIFSDMQIMDARDYTYGRERFDARQSIPPNVPIFVFNTGGYQASPLKSGRENVYELGGFTDAVFRMIPLVENRGSWPWED